METPLTVRGVAIGSGTPKICVPVMGKHRTDVLDSLAAARAVQPDILEWRIDYLSDCSPSAVVSLLEKVRTQSGNLPLLVTFRTKQEGGQQAIPGLDYARLLAEITRTDMADLLDMEFSMLRRTQQLTGIRELAREHHLPVIYSYHNFQQTPPQEMLLQKLEQMRRHNCDIAKIAVMPKSPADVLTLLSATEAMKRLHPELPLVTMSMGQMGAVSRLCGETFGSAITFGSAQTSSAPGQVPAPQLRRILSLLHNGTTDECR